MGGGERAVLMAVLIDMTTGATTINFNTGAGDPRYVCQLLDGWGSGALRFSSMELVGADKEIVTEVRLAARVVVLGGIVWASTEALRWSAWNAMINAFECVTVNGTLTVHESVNKTLSVRRRGELKLARTGPMHFGWQATLWAGDPTKA